MGIFLLLLILLNYLLLLNCKEMPRILQSGIRNIADSELENCKLLALSAGRTRLWPRVHSREQRPVRRNRLLVQSRHTPLPDFPMALTKRQKTSAVDLLNKILEAELSGVVRYTHYSFMVYGYDRIPIVTWLRQQADESLLHAQEAGEMITHLGEHPSLSIGEMLETHEHDIDAILRESLEHETQARKLYQKLLTLATDRSVVLEEYARKMVAAEEMHAGEVDKMLRRPGSVAKFAE